MGKMKTTRFKDILLGVEQLLLTIRIKGFSDNDIAKKVRDMLSEVLRDFPWIIRFTDWTGSTYSVGGNISHWSGREPMNIHMKTREAGHDLLAFSGMRFMERFLDGEVDITGNLYLFPEIRNYAKFNLKPWQIIQNRIRNLVFQTPAKARESVKSHYDIPEDALFYLDRVYRSYSCGIFERPHDLNLTDVLTVGEGESDKLDTLEKAQWRKFAHAADFLAPKENETILDVGCGYPGFLMVLMDRYPVNKVVGWTHSANQVTEGKAMLKGYDPERYELNEGDYREDKQVYDHIHSTGMISHVGPPGHDSGLVNYVREVRGRIKTHGRYVHHALMTSYRRTPLFDRLGPAFNRRYVWPGFYWYTLGEHVKALEENGFQVNKIYNLSYHYAKTTRAWYERIMEKKETFIEYAGEHTFRAWQIFLAGITGSYLNRQIHCYRIFCEATDIEKPSIHVSDPTHNVAPYQTIDL